MMAMPRTADPEIHARRRAQLVEAVFRIVRRDGIEHVSVRAVAAEAGLSMGALRHYFATQAELLGFALGEVERRIEERLHDLDLSGEPAQIVKRVVNLLVPMTPQSRLEHEIWFAFVSKAVSDSALSTLNERVYDELRQLLADVLPLVLAPDADADLELERLYALVDGLVLHAVMRPSLWPPERLSAVLTYHLNTLRAGIL